MYINRNNDIIATANEAIFSPDLTWFKILGKSQTQVFSTDKKASSGASKGIFK